jgi:hypothetical protein
MSKTAKTTRPAIPTRPPRTEAEARALVQHLIERDRKMLERLAKR